MTYDTGLGTIYTTDIPPGATNTFRKVIVRGATKQWIEVVKKSVQVAKQEHSKN
jgi:hypothetical protein